MIDILFAFLVAFIWGVFPFALKYASDKVSTNIIFLILAFVWFLSACIYNIVLYKGNLIYHLKEVKYNIWIILIIAGFIGLFIKNMLYLHVIDITKRLNVAISIMSLSSIVSLFYALYILKYDLKLATIIGICLTAIGVILMINTT